MTAPTPAVIDKTQWSHLYDEVVTTGLCTGCSACVVVCPFHVLGYEDDEPVQLQPEGPGQCSHGDKGCDICTRACPRFRDWEADIDKLLWDRVRTPEEVAGPSRRIMLGRATDMQELMHGQDGGAVSALLRWGLRTDQIDGACVSKLSSQRQWDAEPAVITTEREVLATAGSRYTYSANPMALTKAAEMGLSKLALVGMSCQSSVTGALEARRVNKWRKKIAWTFGLLCSKTFTYDGLMGQIAQEELGLNIDDIARVNVKGKLLFYTQQGEEHTYPLKKAHEYTRPGCMNCPDFAAEHSDISFGGIGESDGWTLAIIRTELGDDIWTRAVAEDVIEERPGESDPKALEVLGRLATNQRKRWPEALTGDSAQPGMLPTTD